MKTVGILPLIGLLLAIAAAAAAIAALIRAIYKFGESHPVTTESFRTAGIALCEKLHGGNSQAYAACAAEVMAEAARALATQSRFDTGNVPSIPPGNWP